MDARRAFLGSADVKTASIKLNLRPFQVANLGSSEAVAIGNQDHRAVAMAMAIALGGFYQPLDLAAHSSPAGRAMAHLTARPKRCRSARAGHSHAERRVACLAVMA